MKAGAGGNWRRFDEKFDAILFSKQTCLAFSRRRNAVKNSRNTVFSDKIRDIIGVPSHSRALAECLNQFDSSEDGKIGAVWRREKSLKCSY